MKDLYISAAVVAVALFAVTSFFSGLPGVGLDDSFTGSAVTQPQDAGAAIPAGNSEAPSTETVSAPDEQASLPLIGLAVSSVGTDSDLYHSADSMKLTAVIDCGEAANGVTVTAKGISGKMNLVKTVDLDAGRNVVTFDYKLPTCNVCGGIKPGEHSCTVVASYGEESASGSATVQIEQ